jgi:hypothetical protein
MDEMAKEIENALKQDFPNARLKHAPHSSPGSGEPKPERTTVIQDIEALKAKLALIAKGIEMLREQL